MPIKWAIANGSWTDGTIWNNGSAPVTGDCVYANGHTVTIGNNLNIGNGTISNAENADYGIIAGGGFNTSSSGTNLTMNMEQSGSNTLLTLRTTTSNAQHTIIGNIISDNGNAIYVNAGSNNIASSISLTGNISAGYAPVIEIYGTGANSSNANNITINGNVSKRFDVSAPSLVTANAVTTMIIGGGCDCSPVRSVVNVTNLTVSGNFTTYKSFRANSAIIMGDVKIMNNAILGGATSTSSVLTLYGSHIEYENTSGYYPLTILLSSQNPSNLTIRDITNIRSLPYIIVTDYDLNNVAQYPPENRVYEGVVYAFGQRTGTFAVDYPPEPVVLKDYVYDNGNLTGTLETISVQADYPNEDDVRFGVAFDFGYKSGKCHVPLPEDVREGVLVDVNAVGTLIPSSGGDRLRIADFSYYTRSSSITYIVDLTESDKPAFADCEEIVLLSLFPTLDLNNIPDKFFDDLFVQFLRYRLLVEYYRGISVNSKFTPSEPTTEIVNYANTKCEYWLNTANLFLQLWGEKYPNSVKKDRILL